MRKQKGAAGPSPSLMPQGAPMSDVLTKAQLLRAANIFRSVVNGEP